ncbi:MAG TPA: hypothetical protein VHC92_06970, partial [Rhodanobacteraceae bacterium]|nr:hypothetical protein [Rhodanobacteraceae bacterium]
MREVPVRHLKPSLTRAFGATSPASGRGDSKDAHRIFRRPSVADSRESALGYTAHRNPTMPPILPTQRSRLAHELKEMLRLALPLVT